MGVSPFPASRTMLVISSDPGFASNVPSGKMVQAIGHLWKTQRIT
jgi:hypothetical protein